MRSALVTFTAASAADPEPGPWDPLAAPYVMWQCRFGRHPQCPGSLAYFPQGAEGSHVDIACACTAETCSCAVRRAAR